MHVISRSALDVLLNSLRQRGYQLIGPTVRDQAILYDEIRGTQDLPIGVGDEQSGGRYRLRRRNDQALFGYVVGPQSWKKYLFPPRQRLLQITRNGGSLEFQPQPHDSPRLALIGVRACELAAIEVQDRVFSHGPFADARYQARRRNLFIIAVNCGSPAATCFCTSMDTGPRAKQGFDLALTEILDEQRHEFLVEVGSDAGRDVLATAPFREATAQDRLAADHVVNEAARAITRRLDRQGARELLHNNYENSHWDEVAARCLSCANCTMVCPTCFCSNVEDSSDLSGDHAERWRTWDSCFTSDFSYIVGGSVRPSTKSRYRQWLTHKLSTWHDQFGTSGCVGCGRCITWCPVGIDLTEEIPALQRQAAAATPTPKAQENAT